VESAVRGNPHEKGGDGGKREETRGKCMYAMESHLSEGIAENRVPWGPKVVACGQIFPEIKQKSVMSQGKKARLTVTKMRGHCEGSIDKYGGRKVSTAWIY